MIIICQVFSFAGKQKGSVTKCNIEITTLDQYLKLKNEGFEFDGQSYLFWEYVRLREEIQPEYFLLENVKMTKKWGSMFNEAMSTEPIEINSALLSAQNRKRLYWTNIPNIAQPEDKGILLKDILETEGVGGIKSHGKVQIRDNKAICLDANYFKGADNHGQRTMIHIGDTIEIKGHDSIKRVYHPEGKSPTLITCTGGHREPKVLVMPEWNKTEWRKLSPLECERLQTVPDGYTEGVSNSQRYKMLGNGWTVAVIEHIFKGVK